MATKAALSETEFLRTSFPDVEKEYRDGEVLERSMPNMSHSRSQHRFDVFFGNREKSHSLFACPGLRLRLRTGRYVTPDICLFWQQEPQMPVPEILPLVVIEILSPDDKLAEVRDKLQEYRDWGVAHVWLTDPERRIFYVYDHGLLEVPSYHVPELNLEVKPTDIFD
jgi:Uma2 family endonuclease